MNYEGLCDDICSSCHLATCCKYDPMRCCELDTWCPDRQTFVEELLTKAEAERVCM